MSMIADLQTLFNEDDFADVALYVPKSGTPYGLSVIFDDSYQVLDPQTEMVVQSTQPQVTVPVDWLHAKPVQGDLITVANAQWVVREYQPDGHGLARLFLTRK